MMRRRLSLGALLCVLAGAAVPALSADLSRPAAFPEVARAASSRPRYAAIAIDPWDAKRAAFLLFDGNPKEGYRRLYLWVPGDKKYDPPVALASADGKSFPPAAFEAARDGQRAAMTWQFAWRLERSGGRSTHVDYVTGKTVTTESEAVEYAAFDFRLDLALSARGQGTAAAKPELESCGPLDVTITGQAPAGDAWDKLGDRFDPWNRLNYGMGAAADPTAGDEKSGRIKFTGRLAYGGSPLVIRALPEETDVTLLVSPHMKPPVYSNRLTLAEAFGAGVGVDVPFGWYDFGWTCRVPGLGVSCPPRTVAYPFARPAL